MLNTIKLKHLFNEDKSKHQNGLNKRKPQNVSVKEKKMANLDG